MRLASAGTLAAAALAVAPSTPALAATTDVGANGNVFTGGLSFTPAAVNVAVGDTVRWRNTDPAVPHTATEDHGLWDLGGSYGSTPANPPGFGPGATVERTFEAGTHAYLCKVHPRQMRGTVAVAPTLAIQRVRVRVRRKPARRSGASAAARRKRPARTRVVRYLVATWATSSPASGLAFDVQRRSRGRDWSSLRSGTQQTSARFRVSAKRTAWEVRARLRRIEDDKQATDWSPLTAFRG